MKIWFFTLSLCLSGCILAPAIKGVQDAGLRSSDRQMKLGETLKVVKEGLYWGQMEKVLAYANADALEPVQKAFSRVGRSERITEIKVDNASFAEDGYTAKVAMVVRYFRVPEYLVQERIDTQDWEYSFSDGWKMNQFKIGEEGPISSIR